MGLWPFSRAQEEKPHEAPAKPPAPQPEGAQQPSAEPAKPVQREEDASTAAASATDAATDYPVPAVFAFGGPAVDSGIMMKGICAADDPDQIQACLWRVDPASKEDTPKDEAKYQIIF